MALDRQLSAVLRHPHAWISSPVLSYNVDVSAHNLDPSCSQTKPPGLVADLPCCLIALLPCPSPEVLALFPWTSNQQSLWAFVRTLSFAADLAAVFSQVGRTKFEHHQSQQILPRFELFK